MNTRPTAPNVARGRKYRTRLKRFDWKLSNLHLSSSIDSEDIKRNNIQLFCKWTSKELDFFWAYANRGEKTFLISSMNRKYLAFKTKRKLVQMIKNYYLI